MTDRFRNDVAIVTGGAAGIGEATCERFAEEGATVVVADRDAESARRTANQIESDVGTEALAVDVDVGVPSDVAAMANECRRRFGTVDVLVNNAAIRVETGPLTDADPEAIDRITDVNLKGVIYCSKHVIPLMEEGGAIVNVASVGASVARRGWGLYDATKGAIVSLTHDVARDHADQGIRINAISPGYAVTDYHVGDRAGQAAERFVESETTRSEDGPGIAKRAATPEEIADGILYLASDEASYVTGENHMVDGGASLTGL